MTPAIDLVVKHKIEHRVHSYVHSTSAESYGLEAVECLGVDAVRVFKTLVVELSSSELVVAMVPVASTLILKNMAKVAGAKKAMMADKNKVQRVTGYVLGGVSALGQRKALTTFIDESAKSFESVFISAGKRGLEIELSPSDLTTLCGARFAAIACR